MKILLAVDGSECGEAAARYVGRSPWPAGSAVRIVSAMEPPSMVAMPETWAPPTDYYEVLEQAAESRARHAVERALRILTEEGTPLVTSSEIVRGLPKEAIVHEAETWKADLIVVGSHGYRGIKRLWLGSVSQAVSANAPCSVLIIRGAAG